MLQKKLGHFRSWVNSVHTKVQQVNPQAIKNSKRLYVGNLPPETTEVGSARAHVRTLQHGLLRKRHGNHTGAACPASGRSMARACAVLWLCVRAALRARR